MPIHPRAQEAAKLVRYEWDMFVAVVDLACALKESGQLDQLGQNVLVECLLVHARNLREFFVADPRHDDVSAQHYFDSPGEWKQVSGGLCPHLLAERERLNRALAHISFSRIDYEQQGNKKWDFPVICQEIKAAWDMFLSTLPADRKAWFTDAGEV